MENLLKALKEQMFEGISQMLSDFYKSLVDLGFLKVYESNALIDIRAIVSKNPEMLATIVEICRYVQAYSTCPIIEVSGIKVKGDSVFGKSNLHVTSEVAGHRVNYVSVIEKDGILDSIKLLIQQDTAKLDSISIQETLARYASKAQTVEPEVDDLG